MNLKPCPFCGSEAITSCFSIDVYNWYEEDVCCEICKLNITHPQAIQIWNNRPKEDALKAENEQLKEVIKQLKEKDK